MYCYGIFVYVMASLTAKICVRIKIRVKKLPDPNWSTKLREFRQCCAFDNNIHI